MDHDRPPPDRQGLVLFFTGLSGSGKSTLARALVDLLLEQGERTVTSLDGDVVRRNLSAGLTFSREDRETNIRRIGWVAAEISRHGGVAVVQPDRAVRRDPAAGPGHGRRRRRRVLPRPRRHPARGVRAPGPQGAVRQGAAREIPEFTGISSPYEEPEDADVRVDTTGRTIEDALGRAGASRDRLAARRGFTSTLVNGPVRLHAPTSAAPPHAPSARRPPPRAARRRGVRQRRHRRRGSQGETDRPATWWPVLPAGAGHRRSAAGR